MVRNNAHYRQNLEEIVFGKVLLRVVLVELRRVSVCFVELASEATYRPEIVYNYVEDTQYQYQHDSAKFRFEANDNHHTGNEAQC